VVAPAEGGVVLQARSWLPRTEGSIRLRFARRGERTTIDVLHQAGAARVRFPKPADGAPPEAVLLNTAGGLTGGDRIDLSITLGVGAEATVASAAAEKIYRARDGEASIRVKLALEAGARLAWLPQPTIVFDRSRFNRRTEIELVAGAHFFAVETILFGRSAMGEDVERGACRDSWRIRRGGRLAFADTFQAVGAISDVLDRPGTLQGARAVSTLLYVAPDAAKRIDEVRALLENARATAGASTWNNLLVVRAIAGDGRTLLQDLTPAIERLSGRALPRVWQC
jgi:urease accessory protein